MPYPVESLGITDLDRHEVIQPVFFETQFKDTAIRKFFPLLPKDGPGRDIEFDKFGTESMRALSGKVGPMTTPPLVNDSDATVSFTLGEHRRRYFLRDRVVKNNQSRVVNLMQRATMKLARVQAIWEEVDGATDLMDLTNWTSAQKKTPIIKWDISGAKWGEDVYGWCQDVADAEGILPDILGVCINVHQKIKYAIAEIVTGKTSPVPLTYAELADYFEMREYTPLSARYNASDVGETATGLTRAWGSDQLLLAAVAPEGARGEQEPSFGYTSLSQDETEQYDEYSKEYKGTFLYADVVYVQALCNRSAAIVGHTLFS